MTYKKSFFLANVYLVNSFILPEVSDLTTYDTVYYIWYDASTVRYVLVLQPD